MLITEHEFELPNGYVDKTGTLHRTGTMRLATGADEILPMNDPRVRNLPAYLIIILLSRVIVRLGTLTQINPGVIEGIYSEDLSFLQDMYNRINGLTRRHAAVRCPHCAESFDVEVAQLGGSPATP
jgi:hypothetical protein